MRKVAILQPLVPHYRTEFFEGLRRNLECLDIYVYTSLNRLKTTGLKVANNGECYINNWQIKKFLLYSPRQLLNKKYDTLVLMLNFAHITTWLLLLTKFVHHKKIVLWGQGISVKRYIKEESKPDWKLWLLIYLSDGMWFYTEKELNIWQKFFPHKKMVSLNNTLSGVENMIAYESQISKEELKERYNIGQKIVFIYCARFNSNYRRIDWLLNTIQRLDSSIYGFIIIGAGHNKPDFSLFKNVYDFGAIYDSSLKQDLFTIADIYYQPGWVGLSIVEAMAYGKPIFTFKRSADTKQCVEYAYIQSGINGVIFENMDDCIRQLKTINANDIICMGKNARKFARSNLTMKNMVKRASALLATLP